MACEINSMDAFSDIGIKLIYYSYYFIHLFINFIYLADIVYNPQHDSYFVLDDGSKLLSVVTNDCNYIFFYFLFVF